MSDDRKSVPLFLCCAEDNEVALVRVVEALQKEGYNPEVVSGVDGDSSLLGNAVDQAAARALFVLCRSDALDRSHLRRLEGLFSARRGPQQRVLTATLVEDKPLEIMPAIREAMRALLAAPAEPTPPSSELSRDLMRDVIGPEGHDARGEADREELARKLHEEMVAAEALLTRRSQKSERLPELPDEPDLPDEPPPSRLPSAELPDLSTLPEGPTPADGIPNAVVEDGTRALGQDSEEEPTQPLSTPLDGGSNSALPYVPEELGESGEEHPVSATSEDDDEAADSLPDGAAVAAAESAAGADDSLDEDTNEQEVGSTTGRHSSTEVAAASDEPPVSRGLVYAGIAGLAAAVVMAISFMGAEPDNSSDAEIEAAVSRAKAKAQRKSVGSSPTSASAGQAPTPATSPAAGVTPAANLGTSSAEPTPPPVKQTTTPPAVDPPPPAEPTPEAVEPTPPAEPTPTPTEPPPPAEPEPTEPPPPAEPPPSSTPPPPTSPSKPANPDADKIKAALAAGTVKDLGSKIVSTGEESQTFAQARRSCRKRNVDGIGRWRLPSSKELSRMKSRGVLDAGAYYWSRDKAESDDEALALDTRTGEINVYLQVESIARAACVRRK